MGNDNATFAEFAENLWKNFIRPKTHEEMRNAVSFYRAKVVTNNGDGTLVIQRPFDSQIKISCTHELITLATEGTQVIVFVFGGTASSNHVAFMLTSDKSISSGASTVEYSISGTNLTFYGMEER